MINVHELRIGNTLQEGIVTEILPDQILIYESSSDQEKAAQ
jgi:hypothetical protein